MTSSEIAYLDHVATSGPGRDYKRRALAALDLVPGNTVLDLGCGPGTDLADLVAGVGPTGGVFGVDADPEMLATARLRVPAATFHLGDAHAVPLADASVDRARADRVLQHVADPARAVAELRRVLRPGGRVVLADNDWDTLVVDDPDLETSRAYTRYVSDERVRNATVGRQLARLCAAVGFVVAEVEAVTVVFRDVAAAERILRISDVTGWAVRDGAMDADRARAWLERVTAGPFLASSTVFVTSATVPN